MKTGLSNMLASPGIPVPDIADLYDFHEQTKATDFGDYLLHENIYQYLFEYRGRAETVANRKNQLFSRKIELPEPQPIECAFSAVLAKRVSTREFSKDPASLQEVSNLLSSLLSTRRVELDQDLDLVLKLRPYPSPGGLYPTETYVVLNNVDGYPRHVCHYDPHSHVLSVVGETDSGTLVSALGGRSFSALEDAPITVFLTSIFERVCAKYGVIGYRFALIEVGILLQQLSLSAAAHDLSALVYAGFFDDEMNDLLGVDGHLETTTGCILVGKKAA